MRFTLATGVPYQVLLQGLPWRMVPSSEPPTDSDRRLVDCPACLDERGVNGQQELTHYGHEELTHRGFARWVTFMRVFPPSARNVSTGWGRGHQDRG
jgi:hypothetical protein